LHPDPLTAPVPCGDSLDGIKIPEDQLTKLLDAGLRYRSFKYWDRIRIDRSEQDITGSGFNCVKFDPRKPARTIRRNDGNLGMHGAMHWYARRRFSLPEFKRFGSFPDAFEFAGEFDEGIRQIGNSVPPLFMRTIALYVQREILKGKTHESLETVCLPDREEDRRKAC
jgi:site-specific DNA-cytosine methylase